MESNTSLMDDPNRPPGDPAVLAAALYANTATNGSNNSTNPAERDQVDESASERPGSSRQAAAQGPSRHHVHHSSSVRTSGPSTSNRNSCTRTQSIGAYSNNMTPISPITNATSFLAVDSSDEKRVSDDSAPQSELGGPDDSSTRPSTSYASNIGDQSSSYSRDQSLGADPSPGRPQSKDFAPQGLNGARSPTQSTATGESIKNDHKNDHPPAADSKNGGSGFRKLPKRRSRLRLAFWKRRNHHQNESYGES